MNIFYLYIWYWTTALTLGVECWSCTLSSSIGEGLNQSEPWPKYWHLALRLQFGSCNAQEVSARHPILFGAVLILCCTHYNGFISDLKLILDVRFWTIFFLAHLVWSKYTYPSMDRGCGDVVDKGAKIKSPDLQVFVCDHLFHGWEFLIWKTKSPFIRLLFPSP